MLTGPKSVEKDPSFLTIEQALADYVVLIHHLKEDRKVSRACRWHAAGQDTIPLQAEPCDVTLIFAFEFFMSVEPA